MTRVKKAPSCRVRDQTWTWIVEHSGTICSWQPTCWSLSICPSVCDNNWWLHGVKCMCFTQPYKAVFCSYVTHRQQSIASICRGKWQRRRIVCYVRKKQWQRKKEDARCLKNNVLFASTGKLMPSLIEFIFTKPAVHGDCPAAGCLQLWPWLFCQ